MDDQKIQVLSDKEKELIIEGNLSSEKVEEGITHTPYTMINGALELKPEIFLDDDEKERQEKVFNESTINSKIPQDVPSLPVKFFSKSSLPEIIKGDDEFKIPSSEKTPETKKEENIIPANIKPNEIIEIPSLESDIDGELILDYEAGYDDEDNNDVPLNAIAKEEVKVTIPEVKNVAEIITTPEVSQVVTTEIDQKSEDLVQLTNVVQKQEIIIPQENIQTEKIEINITIKEAEKFPDAVLVPIEEALIQTENQEIIEQIPTQIVEEQTKEVISKEEELIQEIDPKQDIRSELVLVPIEEELIQTENQEIIEPLEVAQKTEEIRSDTKVIEDIKLDVVVQETVVKEEEVIVQPAETSQIQNEIQEVKIVPIVTELPEKQLEVVQELETITLQTDIPAVESVTEKIEQVQETKFEAVIQAVAEEKIPETPIITEIKSEVTEQNQEPIEVVSEVNEIILDVNSLLETEKFENIQDEEKSDIDSYEPIPEAFTALEIQPEIKAQIVESTQQEVIPFTELEVEINEPIDYQAGYDEEDVVIPEIEPVIIPVSSEVESTEIATPKVKTRKISVIVSPKSLDKLIDTKQFKDELEEIFRKIIDNLDFEVDEKHKFVKVKKVKELENVKNILLKVLSNKGITLDEKESVETFLEDVLNNDSSYRREIINALDNIELVYPLKMLGFSEKVSLIKDIVEGKEINALIGTILSRIENLIVYKRFERKKIQKYFVEDEEGTKVDKIVKDFLNGNFTSVTEIAYNLRNENLNQEKNRNLFIEVIERLKKNEYKIRKGINESKIDNKLTISSIFDVMVSNIYEIDTKIIYVETYNTIKIS